MSKIQANMLRDAQLKTLWIARLDYMKNSGVNSHIHDNFYQLLVVMEGEGTVQIEDQSYPIIEGYFYLFPEGMNHEFRFSANGATIEVKFSVYDRELHSLLSKPPYSGLSDPNDIADLKQWFSLSLENVKTPHPLLPYRIDSGFKGTLLSLKQKPHRVQRWAKQKTNAIGSSSFPMAVYIRERITEKISLDDIALHFGFHPHYFIKIFNDHMGISPMQYLLEHRLEKAKEYLEFTNLTVTEISEKLNWTQSYFSKLFQQREGISPTEYRKNATAAVGKDIVLAQEFQNKWQIVFY